MEQEIQPEKQPVDRKRRARFIFVLVGVCIFLAVVLAAATGTGFMKEVEVVTAVAGGLLSLATFGAVAYIGGSSLDYNGGIGTIFGKKGR